MGATKQAQLEEMEKESAKQDAAEDAAIDAMEAMDAVPDHPTDEEIEDQMRGE